MSGVQLRRLESDEGGLRREVRLRALRESPDVFSDSSRQIVEMEPTP
jgi:hypothetical protein